MSNTLKVVSTAGARQALNRWLVGFGVGSILFVATILYVKNVVAGMEKRAWQEYSQPSE